MASLPDVFGIIPARYDSKRFPGKPLAEIAGKPMFFHVYQQALGCPGLKSVILATDDDRILKAAEALHVPVLKTRDDHPSGTDRVLEAARQLNLTDNTVVVNIQGDEPLLDPEMLRELIEPFGNGDVQVTTLARKISRGEAQSSDQVKVVFDLHGKALYFSRALIPFPRDDNEAWGYYGHIGLYAFQMHVLQRFVNFPASNLEKTEKLEQLRFLDNGIPIHVAITRHRSIGVDRPEDIAKVSQILLAKGVK